MDYSQQLDSHIEAAAAAKFGTAYVSVIRQDMDERRNHEDSGVWFVLFVDGECLGRRRTKGELLALIERSNATAAV